MQNQFGQAAGRAVSAGAIGGASVEAGGGRFRDGFWFAFGASASVSAYRALTAGQYEPTWRRGREVVNKGLGVEPANPEWINPGYHSPNAKDLAGRWFPPRLWGIEGSGPMQAIGRVPGFNSFSTLHDWVQYSLRSQSGALATALNFPTMVPGLAINYAGLLNGSPAVLAAANRGNDWWP